MMELPSVQNVVVALEAIVLPTGMQARPLGVACPVRNVAGEPPHVDMPSTSPFVKSVHVAVAPRTAR